MSVMLRKLSGLSSRWQLAVPVLFFLMMALRIGAAYSHIGQDAEVHQHHDGQNSDKDAGAGLDEHLGGKIPLDLQFRDETGRDVRLGQLITGPTIVLPVYYSCTNVCNFLQGGL